MPPALAGTWATAGAPWPTWDPTLAAPSDDRRRRVDVVRWGARSSARPWLIPPELEVALCRSWTGRAAPRFDSPRDCLRVARCQSPGRALTEKDQPLAARRRISQKPFRAAPPAPVVSSRSRSISPAAGPPASDLPINSPRARCASHLETRRSRRSGRLKQSDDFRHDALIMPEHPGAKSEKTRKSS